MPLALNWTLLVSAAVFLFTLVVLNRLLFKPLLKVLDQRHAQTAGALEDSARTLDRHESLVAEYHLRIKEERKQGYRLLEEARNATLAERAATLGRAREQSDRLLSDAKTRLGTEVAEARASIDRQAHDIAREISSTILERPVKGREQ